MGCVLAAECDVPGLRSQVEDLVSGVAQRIHFNNDTDRQKRRVLAAINELPVEAVVITFRKRHGSGEFEARRACIQRIVEMLQARSVVRLVLESRQDDHDDRRAIIQARKPDPPLVFEHRAG